MELVLDSQHRTLNVGFRSGEFRSHIPGSLPETVPVRCVPYALGALVQWMKITGSADTARPIGSVRHRRPRRHADSTAADVLRPRRTLSSSNGLRHTWAAGRSTYEHRPPRRCHHLLRIESRHVATDQTSPAVLSCLRKRHSDLQLLSAEWRQRPRWQSVRLLRWSHLGCGSTGCRWTHQRLNCFGVLLVDDSIRSRLCQYVSVVLMCCRYPLFATSGYISTLTSVCEHMSLPPSDRALQHCVRFGSVPQPALLTLICALVVSKVDYCCSVLVDVSDSGTGQAAVHPQRCRPTHVLSQALCTLHPASPRPSLVAGSRTDSIPSLRSGIPMSQWISAAISLLRTFVEQPMWKVVATSAHLPPWRLLSRQCSD